MKVRAGLCKVSANVLEKIAKIPEDIDEDDLPDTGKSFLNEIYSCYADILCYIERIYNE